MSGKLISVLFLFIVLHVRAETSVPSPTDSIGYVYEFDMKYVGSTSHIDENYQYVLGHLIELLNKDKDLLIHVRGHVCCGPSKRLSKKRARKVYKFLKRSGIDKKRISYKGYSDTLPLISPEKTEEDEIRNRRVDFVIYKYE
jgi:outer membrane protein OmpA-like peptidoglycan-associated protein